MTVDISKLHNVLRDNTRARIIELLSEKTSLSYIELQESLKISHTGKLNYHLKVLGDLLVKDERTGRYSLGEKGILAATLLSKFQTVTSAKNTKSRVTRLTSIALIAAVVILVVALIVVVAPKPATATLQVTQFSINPTAINQNSFAFLNLTITNHDATKQHRANIDFDETNSTSVSVNQGNQSLPTVFGIATGDGAQKFQFLWLTIQPSEILTTSFRITATLSAGVLTSTYSIPVEFQDENLTSFANMTVALTVTA